MTSAQGYEHMEKDIPSNLKSKLSKSSYTNISESRVQKSYSEEKKNITFY
jgi:hypothetical protein